ncbi:hypothetical protein Q0Z83_025500 [Actinoplanes sichuanensis]|nr:hypothetical protein Q0Z83_025500 [Actinoplanes sichuanensis]
MVAAAAILAATALGGDQSAEAAASGCEQVHTDVVWFTGFYPPTRQADLAPPADDTASVRLCIYRVKEVDRDNEKRQGDFVSGRVMPNGRWAAVKRAIRTSEQAATCITPASRFAWLETPPGRHLRRTRRLPAPGRSRCPPRRRNRLRHDPAGFHGSAGTAHHTMSRAIPVSRRGPR